MLLLLLMMMLMPGDSGVLLNVQRLLDTLAQDEAEVRRRLVEMTRTITVLRVNEKILARKYTISQQGETGLRQVIHHVIRNLTAGRDWTETGNSPRHTQSHSRGRLD